MSKKHLDVKVRDWTITHWWVRPVVWTWFKIFHRSYTVSGMEHVDWSKPIIFAPTHQSAFTDALCLILPATYVNNRFIYPLVRADVFHNSRLVDWMLTSFHMMPVYRPRDNVDMVAQNRLVFNSCKNLLEKNRNLLIHPEGNCIARKTVRSFKKGLARIALETLESGNSIDQLQVIPVGINYRNITEPRHGIHIRYGPPIYAAEFESLYKHNKSRAINRMTEIIESGVRSLAVDIQSEDHYQLTDELLRFVKIFDERIRDSAHYTQEELSLYKITVQQFDKTVSRDSDTAASLEESLNRLKLLMKHYRLNWNRSMVPYMSTGKLTMQAILLLLSAPVVFYGWLNNLVPWKLTLRSGDMVDDEQFKSSVKLVAGLLLFPILYLLQGLFVYFLSDSWQWALGYLISLPISGILCINLWERFVSWKQQFRLKWLIKMNKRPLEKIRALADRIRSAVDIPSGTNPVDSEKL